MALLTRPAIRKSLCNPGILQPGPPCATRAAKAERRR